MANEYTRPGMRYFVFAANERTYITRRRAVRFMRTARSKGQHHGGFSQTWKLPCGIVLCAMYIGGQS